MTLIFVTSFVAVGILSVMPVSCHIYDSSYILKEFNIETEYFLKENQIYGSVISRGYEAGSHVRVGQMCEKKVGDHSHDVDCDLISSSSNDVYLDEYEPEIHFYGNPPDPDVAYGTFSFKQVWNCTTSKVRPKVDLWIMENMENPPSTPINFYRIMSVVHGVRPVNTIFYFEGIEVILDKTSIQTRKGKEGRSISTATFKEIKYIDPKTKKALQYDGKLHISEEPEFDPLNLFTPLDVNEHKQTENFGHIEPTPKSQIIGEYGATLRVGKSTYTTLVSGKRKQKATCYLRFLEESVYTDAYLPQCSIWNPSSGDYEETYGKSGGKVSANCFSVIKQEEWICCYEVWERRSGFKVILGKKKVLKTFNRRVTEMVGAIPIAKIEYFGAVSVWKYKLNSKSSSVRIEEIYYYQGDFDNQIRFNGDVILFTYSNKPESVKQEDAFFYTYNPNVISAYPNIIIEKEKKPVREVTRSDGGEGGGEGGGGGGGYGGGNGGYRHKDKGVGWGGLGAALGVMCMAGGCGSG